MTPVVFLDTVGMLAVWDSSDQWHAAAEAAFRGLKARRRDLVTSSYVLAECGNAAARRVYRQDVSELQRDMQATGRLVFPSEADWRTAWQAYERGEGAGAGLVDQLSFVVARRLGIKRIFTNDAHFRAAGFEVLF